MSRPRLVNALRAAPIGLIEAGGGYGKSVLADELRRELGTPSAEAALERETNEPQEVIGALRRGLRRAGSSDVAAALNGSGPEEVIAALERAPEPMLLVVEEAQHLSGDAAELLANVARGLPPGHRVLFVGRKLDPRLPALRRDTGAVHLDAEALAFDEGELRQLLTREPGSAPTPTEVAELHRLTLGWPAAAAVAVAWLARGPSRPLRDAFAPKGALSGLLDGLLSGLDAEEHRRISHLAHLPLLSAEVASACAGPGALELLAEAGVPLRDGRPGWVELADPVRDELAARFPIPVDSARAAAASYADSGELATGVALLSGAGDASGITGLLANRPWQSLQPLALAELRAILTTLPPEALADHPSALVQVARLAEQQADLELGRDLLEQALTMLPGGAERREAEAELVATLAIVEPGDNVQERAGALLKAAQGGETKTRARALAALARVEAWLGDPASMLRAEGRLIESAALCRLAREPEWEARTLTGLGYRVAFARGDFEQGITHMSAALALLPDSGRERAAVATFLAEALAYVGRLDDAEAAVKEAAAIGRRLGDHRVQAYAAWTGAVTASLRRDTASTIQRIHTVELHPGDWFEHPTGAEFLADAALALARTGEREAAIVYAENARQRATGDGYPEIAWQATGAVEARWGDPLAAEEALSRFAASPQQAPRDAWRTLLFRALAASRRDDPIAGDLAARAYEAAAELGRWDLPAMHEPDVAEIVQPLASAAGSRAAVAAGADESSYVISLLGGFAVTRGGTLIEPPAGRPTTLVKLLALAGRPIATQEAIEALWPEVDEAKGRQRIRNLLNRLRASCGELVRRDGETLVLGRCEVDADGFERAVAAAAGSSPEARPGLARTALARYAGELLPGDRYESWAAAPRERMRRRYLNLLDLLADDAVERGDVDEAIRLLERAQIAEPLDDDRFLRAAELLLFQGRRGSAQALVDRAADVHEQLGLDESPRLKRLRVAIGGG